MRTLAMLGAAFVGAALVVGCARVEVAKFQPNQGQQTLVRDGVPVIYSRQAQSLVLLRPAVRQFRAGRRPVYVLALYNLTNAPLQFSVGNVHIAQMQDGQSKALHVYTYDELVSEEQTRQTIQAIGVGLGAVGNSMSAASAGNYNATGYVNGPNGVSTVNVHGYDPTAAAIAQNRAAAQNEAMISSAVETGQRNLVNLERAVIKDNTLLQGEWYGGQLQFEAPNGSTSKNYSITVQIGSDAHQINIVQAPTGS
jgi:hypothetical protein